MARPKARKTRATGPGPVRTGRFGEVLLEPEPRERVDAPRLDFCFDDEVRRVWLPDDRDRELLLFATLLLRDLGGEDVRVAMMVRLGRYHISLTRHTPIPRPDSHTRPTPIRGF
jgi:hypothetical protein